MKNFKLFLLLFALSGIVLTTYSCDKDDEATCSDGIQNGSETGVDCGGDCDACPVGLQATVWQSSGSNVAPGLVALLATDSIYAEFGTDFTYHVETFDTAGVMVVFEGTYNQSESGTGTIWDIVLSQSTPSSVTSTGIFRIDEDNLEYEVIQTEPDLGLAAPTAAGGFGSSAGGVFGTAYVQKFVRIQ